MSKEFSDNHQELMAGTPDPHSQETLNHQHRLGGGKFAGVELDWTNAEKHFQLKCRLSMEGYIDKVLMIHDHTKPTNPQLPPHKHR